MDAINPPLPAIAPINTFIGRDKEIHAISAKILNPDVRFLTLSGPGGVGKTRLAIHTAQQLEHQFADGMKFVLLAHARDAHQVLSEIADVLGFKDTADPEIGCRLRNWLYPKEMILVLDNLEQVTDCAPDISLLLKTCPGVTVLATSRMKLNIYGEHIHNVTPLDFSSVPNNSQELGEKFPTAVQLFIDRAMATGIKLTLDDDNIARIFGICRQLDGLPLAIELAAARIDALSIADLEERLQSGLSLLTSTSSDVPNRLRTMQNAIAWSYDLLGSEARTMFRRLTVFANGFTLDAASELMSSESNDHQTLELIESLVSSSLLIRERDQNGVVRFRMLQVIREYGHRQLILNDEAENTRRQHLTWMTAYAQSAAKQMTGQNQLIGLQAIDVENDNIDAALQFAHESGDEISGLTIVSSLWLYWNTRGMISAGIHWTSTFLSNAEEAPEPLLAAGYFTLGILHSHAGNLAESWDVAQKSLSLAESVGDPLQLGLTYYLLGLNCNKSFRLNQAEEYFQKTLHYFRECGEATAEPAVLNDLGRTAYLKGDLSQAKTHYDKALTTGREHTMPRSISMSLHNLGMIAIDRDDNVTAAKYNLEALGINLEHGDEWHVMFPLIALVRVAAAENQMRLAARLTGVAEAMVDEPGVTLWDWSIPDDYAQTLEATKKILANEKLQTEIAEGRQLSLHDAVAEAQVLTQHASDLNLTKSLTPREHDVFNLLLADRTDREIGEELFISHRTVQTHLTSIYRKLGVHSRVEAFEWAMRRGLTVK